MQKVITYIKKVKLVNPLTLFKKWFLADITQTFAELSNSLDNRVDRLECQTSVDDVENRVENLEYDLDGRIDCVEDRSETNQESINIIKDDIKTIKKVDFAGIADRFDKLDDRVDNLEELAKKYLNAELQAVVSKQERSEQSLSDIQRLTFEICHYYGGEFDVDDFDNCYKIVNEYDVVWKRNPQPKKQGGK